MDETIGMHVTMVEGWDEHAQKQWKKTVAPCKSVFFVGVSSASRCRSQHQICSDFLFPQVVTQQPRKTKVVRDA